VVQEGLQMGRLNDLDRRFRLIFEDPTGFVDEASRSRLASSFKFRQAFVEGCCSSSRARATYIQHGDDQGSVSAILQLQLFEARNPCISASVLSAFRWICQEITKSLHLFGRFLTLNFSFNLNPGFIASTL